MAEPVFGGTVLDLQAIAAALTEAAALPNVAQEGSIRPTAAPLERMLKGYRYVDRLLARGVDVFQLGASHHLLELNHLVLCGIKPSRRLEFHEHLVATERRFYEHREAGADALYAWVDLNRHLPPLAFAAGAIVQMVSAPQPFLEGNQRTATLVASLVLVRGGLPPLVMTAANAAGLRRALAACKALDRRSRLAFLRLPWAARAMRRVLASDLDARFLRASSPQPIRADVTSGTA